MDHPGWGRLLVAENRMGPVGFFEFRHRFRAEFDLDRGDNFPQMWRLGHANANNGRGHTRGLQNHASVICVGLTPYFFATFDAASAISLRCYRRRYPLARLHCHRTHLKERPVNEEPSGTSNRASRRAGFLIASVSVTTAAVLDRVIAMLQWSHGADGR